MLITFEHHASNSLLVERIWRSHSERAGTFLSMAACTWTMVVTRIAGNSYLTVRGPETRATLADCPAGGEWVGVQFRPGSFMPLLPVGMLRDRNDATLPQAGGRSFWLAGLAWEYPTFENAETFVNRLQRAGLIVSDPYVQDCLRGRPATLSQRTGQRRFVRATGLTLGAHQQILRARRAANLLREAIPIAQVAHDTGYFDQAHLTRSLKRFIGQTPAQVAAGREQLSLLYNTDDT